MGSPKSPGAGFWPLVIAVTMAGLGLSLILRPTPNAPTAAGDRAGGNSAISLGTLLFYVVALEPLGYLLATAVMLFVQFRWVEGRSWLSTTIDLDLGGGDHAHPLSRPAEGHPSRWG